MIPFGLNRALGMTFYQILTGVLPLVGDFKIINVQASDLPDDFTEYNGLFKK